MMLCTNFRESEFRRVKLIIRTSLVTAFMMLILAFWIFHDMMGKMSEFADSETEFTEAMRIKEEKTLAFKSAGNNEIIVKALSDWLSAVGKYRGRMVEEVLFDLEKFTPNGIYFTSLEYDRVTGDVVISGISKTAHDISKYLEKLERVTSFGSVTLLTKNEYGKDGESSFKMKLLERVPRSVL